MYIITYSPQARRAVKRLPTPFGQRFLSAFDAIANNKDEGLDIVKMTNREEYRLRIGSWRAIYRKNNSQLEILVIKIGGRGDVYK